MMVTYYLFDPFKNLHDHYLKNSSILHAYAEPTVYLIHRQ